MARCTLRYPVECWRYTNDTATVPIWALPWIMVDDGDKLAFKRPEDSSGDEVELSIGCWLVKIDDNEVLMYLDEEFTKVFQTCAESAS